MGDGWTGGETDELTDVWVMDGKWVDGQQERRPNGHTNRQV